MLSRLTTVFRKPRCRFGSRMPELVGTAVATARTGQSLDELRYGEQFSAAHKQIHQRIGNEQPVCVLLQPAIAYPSRIRTSASSPETRAPPSPAPSTSWPVARLGIVRLDQRPQFPPRQHLLHLFQEHCPQSLLCVPLEPCHHRQCPLFAQRVHAGTTLSILPVEREDLIRVLLSVGRQDNNPSPAPTREILPSQP
jgi:hypothetical protein